MNVWPVIIRELRTQSRQVFTYWLRALGVTILLMGAMIVISKYQDESDLGGILFSRLHLLCYLAIWLLVPLSAADCISRERREGTLGLLFLTPLKPAQIIIAKGIVHCARALTLVVAIVPVLTIPFLLGGVTWQQALISVAVNFSAVAWCLGAALVASALSRQAGRAMFLAILLAIAGFVCFPWIVGAILGMNSQTTWSQGYSQLAYDFFAGFGVVALNFDDWIAVLRIFKLPQIVFAVSMGFGVSAAVLVLAVLFAANRLRHSWRDEPPSARAQKLERTFCKPVLGVSFFRRWMMRKLERNPIGWLEQRRWSSRLVMWGWFAIIISVGSVGISEPNFFRTDNGLQIFLGWMLGLSMAVSSVGSFRRERESGVLELLLVSPLSVRRIIGGRIQSLWGQFLPAAAVLLGLWLYLIYLFRNRFNFWLSNGGVTEVWFFAVSFLVIPVIGLHFSVRCRHFISALLLTLLFSFGVPYLSSFLFVFGKYLLLGSDSSAGFFYEKFDLYSGISGFQILIAVGLLLRLHRNLRVRSFPLGRQTD